MSKPRIHELRRYAVAGAVTALLVALGWNFLPLGERAAPERPAPSLAGTAAPAAQHAKSLADLRRKLFSAALAAPEEPARSPSQFPDTLVGRLLAAHWQIATTPAPTLAESEAAYAQSLAKLREYPGEAAQLLEEAYWKAKAWHYDSRFALANTLSDLALPEAYEPLRAIATEPLPQERSTDPHHDSTLMDERMIRMVAVDGLAGLAKAGNRAAEQDLFEIATNPANAAQPSVVIRAVRGYMAVGGDSEARGALIAAQTPESVHFAISAKDPTNEELTAAMPTPEARAALVANESPSKRN